jgi:hypothetical protein
MAAAMLLAACRSEVNSARDASLEKAKVFAGSAVATQPKHLLHQAFERPQLFVDASRSMMGFVGCNRKATDFDVVLDRLTTELGIDSVIRFGERVRGSGLAFEQQLLGRATHCPDFYDRLQNPDYQLFRMINEDSSGRSHVYVTDGVQSDLRGASQSPSVQELQRWLRAGHALAILAFRGAFEGSAWSEQRQQMIGAVSVEHRPFYAFIFASYEPDVDALLRTLSRETLGRATIIRVSTDSVHCTTTPGQRLPKYATLPPAPWAMISASTFNRIRSGPAVIAEYRCQIPTTFPFETVLPRIAQVRYAAWERGRFALPSDPLAALYLTADSVDVKAATSTTFVKAALPFDQNHRFGYYEMRIEPDPGALRPAIRNLSTDSDAQIDSFDRTYRFSWLVEQLARVPFERSLGWSPFAFTVQYR